MQYSSWGIYSLLSVSCSYDWAHSAVLTKHPNENNPSPPQSEVVLPFHYPWALPPHSLAYTSPGEGPIVPEGFRRVEDKCYGHSLVNLLAGCQLGIFGL